MASSTAPSAPPSWVLMVHSSSPSTSERIRSHTGLLAAPPVTRAEEGRITRSALSSTTRRCIWPQKLISATRDRPYRFPSPARTTYSASSQSDVLAGRTAHVEARAPPFFQKITCQSTGALGGGVALVIVTGIERRDHTLIFLISIQFSLMSAGNFQDQLVNIHRNSIGELWQVPLTGKDQQESVLVQRNRIFRRTQVHGRILICTNFRLI